MKKWSTKSCGLAHAWCGICRSDISKKLSVVSMGHDVTIKTRLKIRSSLLGYKHTEEAKRNVGLATKKHAAKNLLNCQCYMHRLSENPSKLSWKLINFLADAGFEIIIPEQRFGKYSIDVLLAEEWIAFEADGEYWHRFNKTDYAARDAYLLEEFNLPVVRLTEKEVNKIYENREQRRLRMR